MKTVVFGILGNVLDAGFHEARWSKWRPTVSLGRHPELPIARFELLHQTRHADTARCVAADFRRVSAETEVRLHVQDLANPWDFEEVFGALHEFAAGYSFVPATVTLPLSGRSRQPSRLSSVVLPLPEGPSSTVNSAGRMVTSMPRSTGTVTG